MAEKLARVLRILGQYDETVVVQQVAVELVGRARLLALAGAGAGRRDVLEVARQRIVLILEANDGGRRLVVATVVDEYGVGGRDQGGIRLGRVARVERHAEHKTVRFDVVLVNGSLVPCAVHCSGVDLAEVAAGRNRERVSVCAGKIANVVGGRARRGEGYSRFGRVRIVCNVIIPTNQSRACGHKRHFHAKHLISLPAEVNDNKLETNCHKMCIRAALSAAHFHIRKPAERGAFAP